MTTLLSQASRTRQGGQLSFAVCRWNLFLYKVCLRNLLLPRLRRENFGNEKFGEALALRSVSIATREAQNCGKLVGFAVCLRDLLSPTWAAKILRTESLARHRRHAAFRSRLVVGTFFFQGLPLEPSSSKVAPRKFWERKIWRSIGATQRFDRDAGGPKLWQVGWIRGLPSGLAFANLGRENFAYRIFSEA